MIDFLREAKMFERGMSLHYMTLHAIVFGIEAVRTLEFGAGMSTRVFWDAHAEMSLGGLHVSISTDPAQKIVKEYFGAAPICSPHVAWVHHEGRSDAVRETAFRQGPFDVVLHDGSHSRQTVYDDLTAVIPHIRNGGMLLVHDALHSYSGGDMRAALRDVFLLFGAQLKDVTLPFGFGLTLVRVSSFNARNIQITRSKVGSPHLTEPFAI